MQPSEGCPAAKRQDWLDDLFANHTDEEIAAELERRGVRMSAFDDPGELLHRAQAAELRAAELEYALRQTLLRLENVDGDLALTNYDAQVILRDALRLEPKS